LVGTLAVALIVWGPRWWTPKPEIEWVNVDAGEFMMGSNEGDSDERPVHPVSLDAFRISKYEVTNAQYAQCVRATVCDEPEGLQYYSDPAYADHPVVYVSWFNAEDFCEWIDGRLPTEAQWEYAARGPEGNMYPWGDELPTCQRAQYWECGEDTVPVGSFGEASASWCGVEDMAGNIWEWVRDWHGDYPSEPRTNPTGPENGDCRMLRGGGFYGAPDSLRAAYRSHGAPGLRYDDIGFRCAAAGPGR
jgi:formylglycine-generating enzyme required for sulfatase activity